MKRKHFFALALLALLVVACRAQPARVDASAVDNPAPTDASADPAPTEQPPASARYTIGPGEEYNPNLNPDNFTIDITNPYFSLPIGKKLVYESQAPDGLERIEILIPGWTKMIEGIETLVFWDRVYLDGELIEDTRDYLAQHKGTGDVWYFGEHVDNYEAGVIVDHTGAWLTGVDGAKPGIWALAYPQVGDRFRNEYLKGEAEDETEVLSVNESVSVPSGDFTGCVKHLDGSPLFAAKSHGYLCKGAGAEVLGVDLVTGDNPAEVIVELIEIDWTGALGIELPEAYADEGVEDVGEFADAVATIEYNSHSEDLGFHVEMDAPGWQWVAILDPEGNPIFKTTNDGKIREHGLTTLLFESAEYPFNELSWDDFLARFPEGEYTLVGAILEGGILMSVMDVTHNIPDPPVIISPAPDAVVPLYAVTIAWEPVTTPDGVEIERYQVTLFPVDPPEGQDPIALDIDLTFEVPGDVTEVEIPASWLMSGAEYQFEIYAMEVDGNKSYRVGYFTAE